MVTVITSGHKHKQTYPNSIIKFLHRLFTAKIAHERPQLRRYGVRVTRRGGGGGEPDLWHCVLSATRQTATRGFGGHAHRLMTSDTTCGYHVRCGHMHHDTSTQGPKNLATLAASLHKPRLPIPFQPALETSFKLHSLSALDFFFLFYLGGGWFRVLKRSSLIFSEK